MYPVEQKNGVRGCYRAGSCWHTVFLIIRVLMGKELRESGARGCPSWCRPLRPLFHFLDDVSYPQSLYTPQQCVILRF